MKAQYFILAALLAVSAVNAAPSFDFNQFKNDIEKVVDDVKDFIKSIDFEDLKDGAKQAGEVIKQLYTENLDRSIKLQKEIESVLEMNEMNFQEKTSQIIRILSDSLKKFIDQLDKRQADQVMHKIQDLADELVEESKQSAQDLSASAEEELQKFFAELQEITNEADEKMNTSDNDDLNELDAAELIAEEENPSTEESTQLKKLNGILEQTREKLRKSHDWVREEALDQLQDQIKSVLNKAKGHVRNASDKVQEKTQVAVETVQGHVRSVSEAAQGHVENFSQKAQEHKDQLTNKLGSLFNRLKNLGNNQEYDVEAQQ